MPLSRNLVAATAALSLALPASASATAVGTGHGGQVPIFLSPYALAAGDVDRSPDLYVRAGDSTRLVSDGATGETPVLKFASKDGSVVFFKAGGALHVRTATELEQVGGADVALAGNTPDGKKAYLATPSALVADDTDTHVDVYEYTTATGALQLLSTGTPNAPAAFEGANPSGSMVYFSTTDPVTISDKDASLDIFVTNGVGTVKVSPGDSAHGAYMQALGATNNRVVFRTSDALVPEDTDTAGDLYATSGGTPTLLTSSPNPAADAETVGFVAASESDAHRVLFSTEEQLVAGDTDSAKDLYAIDEGKLTLLTPGVAAYHVDDVSADAETVLFSTVSKVLPSDTDDAVDMYTTGDQGPDHLMTSDVPFDQSNGRLSPGGGVAAFETAEPALPSDADALDDVYAVVEGQVLRHASAAGAGTPADASVASVLSSGDVVFNTTEPLIASDRDQGADAYGWSVTGALAHVSADTFAPDTRMATADGVSTLETDEDGGFECRVDGAEWAACAAPWAVGPLAPGEHVLEARAVDVAGNADATPARSVVTVAAQPGGSAQNPAADRVAPAVSSARLRIRRRVPRLTFSLSETASVRVKVQRKAGRKWRTLRTVTIAGKAGANRRKLAKLPRRGTFRVVLTATDAAGNASAKLTLRAR